MSTMTQDQQTTYIQSMNNLGRAMNNINALKKIIKKENLGW